MDNESMIRPYVWVDANGRQHTAWLIWSTGRWCLSTKQNESAGSPSLIPLPETVPPPPDPAFIPRSVALLALSELEAEETARARRTLLRAFYPSRDISNG